MVAILGLASDKISFEWPRVENILINNSEAFCSFKGHGALENRPDGSSLVFLLLEKYGRNGWG